LTVKGDDRLVRAGQGLYLVAGRTNVEIADAADLARRNGLVG
jgi:hypothetical protein